MANYPLLECAEAAEQLIKQGAEVYQKFTCKHCKSRQTMPVANQFFTSGLCEQCDSVTDIAHDGCNYMVIWKCRGDAELAAAINAINGGTK